ncbi:MAG: hypothetical protein CBB74_05975, partial [Owenweeksia sp. TMED14]
MRIRFGAFLLAIAFVFNASAQSRPGSLRGVVKDKKSGDEQYQAVIKVLSGGYEIAKGLTDFDGRYNINPITPGTYTVSCEAFGYNKMTFNGVEIVGGRPIVIDFKLTSSDVVLGEVDVVADYEAPLIEKGKTSFTMGAAAIRNLASRGVSGVLSLTSGVVQDEGSGASYFRGGRSDANVTFIDGVKVRGSVQLPREAIAQTEVITGGVPANYGDVTGGVISTTTRGPSPRFFGTGEYVTSALFDPYNYNLAGLTIGGPLLFNKEKNAPLVGYLMALEFQHNGDSRPYATPVWKVKDDVLENLNNNPLLPTAAGLGTIRAAELLRFDDLETVNRRLNVARNNIRATGNINIKTSDRTNLVIGGRFIQQYGRNGSRSNALMNYQNNSVFNDRDFSTFARFTQQFGGVGEDSESLIKNAFYTIQADYTRNLRRTWDDRHRDNIFQYGHVGTFETQRTSLYGYGEDEKTGIFSYRKLLDLDTAVVFTPSSHNPILANYTSTYY